MQSDNGAGSSYLDWKHIDSRPVVEELLPTALLEFLRPGGRVLEVGCGSGAAAVFLAQNGFFVEGMDANASAIHAAKARAKVSGVDAHTRFYEDDFITSNSLTNEADAVVLIRVLTCLPDRSHWLKLLARTRRRIRVGGYVYADDFLLAPEHYAARYEHGVRQGWRYGTFAVPECADEPLFIAHHHTEEELSEICQPYRVLKLVRVRGLSMHGNPCQMFELIARREN